MSRRGVFGSGSERVRCFILFECVLYSVGEGNGAGGKSVF